MLKVSGITKRYGDRLVLDGVSFVVNAGECAGIVAPNGAGKTTLLDIIAGVAAADGGSVDVTPAGARVAYVRQGHAPEAERPVAHAFPLAFDALASRADLQAAAEAMAAAQDPQATERAQAAYQRALDAVAGDDGTIAAACGALGLRAIAPHERVAALSGGEATKLSLVEALAGRPQVLLLDEPTNNLDLEAGAWLDDEIAAFEGPVLLVSHDRALLDAHAGVILDLDPATGRVEAFAGGYSEYAAEKARRRDAQHDAYRRQQEHERKVEREVRAIKATASRRERSSQNDFYRRKAKKVARRAVVLERRLRRGLEGEARVEKPAMRPYRLKTEIATGARGGDRMLSAEGIRLEAGGRVLAENISLALGWRERAVMVGANGAGKTTLLRALVGETEPAAGVVRRSPSARLGYLAQDEALAGRDGATPLAAVRAAAPLSETEARRFLHRFLFEGDAVHMPVRSLSYGERRRLSLAMVVLSGANILVLDEPTNHLDIPSREALEQALESYDGAMLAVTHDRYFIERFAQRVLVLGGGGLSSSS